MLDQLDRLPSDVRGRIARGIWTITGVLLSVGIVTWAFGLSLDTFVPGIVAMWCFAVAAVLLAWVLPLPLAIVSPLFMGIFGWLVDMLPYVVLLGWSSVVVRWGFGLMKERRLPGRGRWVWIPVGLVLWPALGATGVLPGRHRDLVLLLVLQVLASAAVVIMAECFERLEAQRWVVSALLLYVIVCSTAVFLQWTGVPLDALQDDRVSGPVERAYSLDAFADSNGMISYVRAADDGSEELRERLAAYRKDHQGVPAFEASRAPFGAYGTALVVRFEGSARAVEDQLRLFDIELLYDNVGLAPGNEVPVMRSFARDALTYAGICVAVLPLAFFFLWTERGRRRWIGRLAIAACLFGTVFSLARGAWVALAVGVLYLFVERFVTVRRLVQVGVAVIAGIAVLAGVFLVKYGTDPLRAREETTVDIGGRILDEVTIGDVNVIQMLLPIALYVVAWLFARRGVYSQGEPSRTFSAMAATAVVIVAAHAALLNLYIEPIYTLTVSVVVGLAIAGVSELPGPLLPFRLPWQGRKPRAA